MASQILRRIEANAVPAEVIRRVNAVIDMLNGNLPGRINLDADDGAKLNPIGGASISTGNHAMRVRAASGEHVLVRNAANSADLLEVDDTSGVTTGALSVGGNLTIVGTVRRLRADLSNATISNRLLVQSSTTNGESRLGIIPNGTATKAGWAAYSSSTPDNSHYVELLANATDNTIDLITSKAGTGTTRDVRLVVDSTVVAKIVAGTLALRLENTRWLAGYSTGAAEVPLIRVNGADVIEVGATGTRLSPLSPLTNNTPLYGRNAANSASVALVNFNTSDIMETGATGTRHNLLGTVVAPAIDPPTVNGQVTAEAVAAAWAHFTVAGGAVTLRDSYNVTSVTYNAAGDFTVAWNRDFSTAYYACTPSVVDNGGVLLAPKVNSQAAGSVDIWVYNAAATKTDPDGVSVVAFGQLS